jgi:hypothetical protein
MRSRAAPSRRQKEAVSDFGRTGVPKEVKQRTVYLLEHFKHRFDVVMVEEPCLGILVVLLKRHPERVGYVD